MSAKDAAPRLGRGLAALLGEPPALSEDVAPRALPVDRLEPGPFQPRRDMDPQLLSDLTDSIRRQGVLQPLLVRPAPGHTGRYQIIAGERRWRAAQDAGLAEVPVLIRELADQDAMAASLVENLQRHDLDPIEEAEGYQRLIREFGLTQEKLGEAVGKSRSHVANILRLLNLPASVRDALRQGKLSAGHARALLAHHNPEAAAQIVIGRGLNVRQTEALAQAPAHPAGQGSDPSPRRPARDPETEALERDLSARLGLKVQIAFDGAGGTVRIHYRNLEQLDGIVTLLSRP